MKEIIKEYKDVAGFIAILVIYAAILLTAGFVFMTPFGA